MPLQDDRAPNAHREETTAPQNPPNSVLQPAARKSAVRTYVGGLLALFLIVGAAAVYWTSSGRGRDTDVERPDAASIGTAGERAAAEESPGGIDPDPDHGSTREELEFRGAGERPQGPMPGLGTSAPLTELGAITGDDATVVAGRRIDVQDVTVDSSTSSDTFTVKDGDARAQVVAPSGAPRVEAGQRVNVSGNVEPDGRGGVQIRATRVVVR